MHEPEIRSLHLHTLDSLISDLVSGRPVQTSASQRFILPDKATRSALEWYRKKGSTGWTADVKLQHGEELVDAILQEPPELPALPARTLISSRRRLRLKKMEAHRFAGLHKFGTLDGAPKNYTHEFTSSLTLFEGRNGSGKTSLLNAIIWALTGQMLRPQRTPEAVEDFMCGVSTVDEGDEQTSHKLSPITPMPNVEQYRPNQPWIPADTWVELTFIDENDMELPVVRRSLSRSPGGKLIETMPDLSLLRLDPIALRIGTVMPGLLPLIKVGSESELGRAVSQLTGLSAIVDLTDHVRRAKYKIDKEFVKNKTTERDRYAHEYGIAKADLDKILSAHPNLKPDKSIPHSPNDEGIDFRLDDLIKYFEHSKAAAFESAQYILNINLNQSNTILLSDIEKNTNRALERTNHPKELVSAVRLKSLHSLTNDQLNAAASKIHKIVTEGKTLYDLAQSPSTAARTRLYARVATWIADHPDPQRKEDICVICGGSLDHAIDPVTRKMVKTHIHEATSEAALLSQTLNRWAANAQGDLLRTLPEALRSEMAVSLPAHPCDLLRAAIVDELFAFEPFHGVLGNLKAQTASTFDEVVKNCSALVEPTELSLPMGCDALHETLKRLDCAIRFARWRQANETLVRDIFERVLGRTPRAGEPNEKVTLTSKLVELESTVRAAQPISDALVQCGRLKQHLKGHRNAASRLVEYATASAALGHLANLGQLADEQVDQLRKILRKDAAGWRSRIYLGAFPDTAHDLIDTRAGRKGELDLIVQAGGISAPAQHVTNASALRASLVAFFLAFWEYILKDRGGLTTLLLDDPQELLDDENRERLAEALIPLVATDAQLIVTSYDPRFCARVSRLVVPGGVAHHEVHPATRQQPLIRTTLPLPALTQRKKRFETDRNAEEPARDFADGCRVFFEAKLGNMFDDPAHAAWAITNPDPTLATFIQRLRPLVKASPQGLFSAHIFRRFVDHPALVDNSPVIALMNKAHHGRRDEIRAADVARCAEDLSTLIELVEEMSDEAYRWRRRDAPKDRPKAVAPPTLPPLPLISLNIPIYPDLAAFTRHGPSGESQEAFEYLDPHLLDNTAVFYLRRQNFGFAAPAGALAIVEAAPGAATDRRLVIARRGLDVFARRLVRGVSGGIIGLTAEVPDPRTRTPKTIMLPEDEVAIHQVVGIIFKHSLVVENGQEEAVQVDASGLLKRTEVGFRVFNDSAVPLALKGQVVIGGDCIKLDELGGYKETLVALTLDDGSGIFKRVGAALPGELAHLRQFESIGGLGFSDVLSIGKPHRGLRSVTNACPIIAVLYHG